MEDGARYVKGSDQDRRSAASCLAAPPASEAAALALGTAATALAFTQSIVSITSAPGNGSHYVDGGNVSNAGMKLNVGARLAHRRSQLRRPFGLLPAPGLSRAQGQVVLVLTFPPAVEGSPRHADSIGRIGCAQTVVTGAMLALEGFAPCNMTGQAENLHDGSPSSCLFEPTAPETPNPPSTAPSHICLNPVRD